MTLHLWVLLVGCVTLLESACVPYKPTLHLEESPHTIPAKVYLELLDDASPPEDKEDASGQSLSQTSTQLMEGDLTTLVTQAILADFRATSVFQSISSQQENPDLILSGTIHRFYGQVSLPSWLLIPGVKLAVQAFWGIVQGWEGDVDLELTLARSDVVGAPLSGPCALEPRLYRCGVPDPGTDAEGPRRAHGRSQEVAWRVRPQRHGPGGLSVVRYRDSTTLCDSVKSAGLQ
ncbi:MAG: hypothetical protein E6K69_08100 [Nitrospirae bacterium]|nr:MAG: hypothetical protein E6K69_08100 [Nitrospirota bacterium]